MFKAYSDDETQVNIQGDDLTVANGTAKVVISGTLEVTRDKKGLRAALALKEAVDQIVGVLQADAALPDEVAHESTQPTGTVANPFN